MSQPQTSLSRNITVTGLVATGISSMIGYRYIYKKETFLNYDGLYYSIGLWLDFRQIYRDIKYYKIQKRNYRKQINHVLYN